MPKVKMPRSTPSLDMTPMVDLAFLLVTFFMLTSSFRAPEPVLVDPPSSTTEIQIPKQVFLATIDKDGRVFVDITNNAVKMAVTKKVMAQYKVPALSDEDLKKFCGMGPFGLRLKEIQRFMELETAERNATYQPGVPYDTSAKVTECELKSWAYETQVAAYNDYKDREQIAKERNMPFDPDSRIQFAIKADANAKYDVVKKVIQVFRNAKVKQFQMITGLEESPK